VNGVIAGTQYNIGNIRVLSMAGWNTFVGAHAGARNRTGEFNSFFGARAGANNDSGLGNSFFGSGSGMENLSGNGNSFFGINAGFINDEGSNNSFFGNRAGWFAGGSNNTFVGAGSDVAAGIFTNATGIGANAIVDASNKIRLGDTSVTVIEGQVGFTASSDRNKKENLLPVEGEEVLGKIRELSLTSWNFIGHDPKQFRHYGPMAQDFFAAFGRDAIGTIGNDTQINSTDMDGILMIAVQALEKHGAVEKKEMEALRAENASLKARLNALETRSPPN
jgi:hypothetical protein